MPLRANDAAEVPIRFGVSTHGKASRIEVLSPSKEEYESAIVRSYKFLRARRFRPRLADGEAVMAGNFERVYAIRC